MGWGGWNKGVKGLPLGMGRDIAGVDSIGFGHRQDVNDRRGRQR